LRFPEGVKIAVGTKISVMVYIGGNAQQKNMAGLPVDVHNLGQGLTADPVSAVDITVSGYQETLDSLKSSDVSLWVDASGLKEGTYADLDVYWKLPSGISMVKTPKVKLVLHNAQTGATTQNSGTQNGSGGFSLPVQIINIFGGE
jgi:YbbR domain-containing protein